MLAPVQGWPPAAKCCNHRKNPGILHRDAGSERATIVTFSDSWRMSGAVVLYAFSGHDGFLLNNQGMLIRESKVQLEQMLAVIVEMSRFGSTGGESRSGSR